MKVVKRDGRIVSYDRQKIVTAIENANQDVGIGEQASTENIKSILAYIEDLNKNRILVEDIQDIVEEKLIEFQKCELANKYKVYKYNGTSEENSNIVDEPVLGIIINDKNTKENTLLNSVTQPILDVV